MKRTGFILSVDDILSVNRKTWRGLNAESSRNLLFSWQQCEENGGDTLKRVSATEYSLTECLPLESLIREVKRSSEHMLAVLYL